MILVGLPGTFPFRPARESIAMFAEMVAVLIVLAVAVAAIGVVVVGQEKHFVNRVPTFARDAAIALRHLDGKAVRPPARVEAAARTGLLLTAHALRRLAQDHRQPSA